MKEESWFVISLIFRFRPSDSGRDNHEDCYGQENWYLYQGEDEEHVIRKSLEVAKLECETQLTQSDGVVGHYECLGIGDLLPINEEIEDGCEVLWEEYQDISLSDLKSRVNKKLPTS